MSKEQIPMDKTIKKSFLYTCTGDSGMTSLVGGSRVPKNSLRLEAYGSVDELNSLIGVVAAHAEIDMGLRAQLMDIMSLLFNLGAYLANPSLSDEVPGIDDSTVSGLEKAIDALDSEVEPMNCFVLPGGCLAAASAHVARTVCRRAERRILDLASAENVSAIALKFVNRLSDYLFAVARKLNSDAGVEEIAWKKDVRL